MIPSKQSILYYQLRSGKPTTRDGDENAVPLGNGSLVCPWLDCLRHDLAFLSYAPLTTMLSSQNGLLKDQCLSEDEHRSSRAMCKAVQTGRLQPYFVQAMNALAGGSLVPVPGGVLIRGKNGVVGAVGVTGDTSDNDEICALAGIEAAGFTADAG